MMAKIEFNNVSIHYPVYTGAERSLKKSLVKVGTGGVFKVDESNHAVVSALDQVSFSIKDGDAVGIVGHNGAGKTTLLRTMAGLYMPTAGRVTIHGRVSTVIELGAGLDSSLSGYENILRLGLIYGLTSSEIKSAISDIESFTELGSFLYSPVSTYSSGMLMRLMFSVSTIKLPDILIVDEMFSTGDASFQEKAERRMESLIDNSKIFVFASHSHELIKRYCNRVFELNHGKLVEKDIMSL